MSPSRMMARCVRPGGRHRWSEGKDGLRARSTELSWQLPCQAGPVWDASTKTGRKPPPCGRPIGIDMRRGRQASCHILEQMNNGCANLTQAGHRLSVSLRPRQTKKKPGKPGFSPCGTPHQTVPCFLCFLMLPLVLMSMMPDFPLRLLCATWRGAAFAAYSGSPLT